MLQCQHACDMPSSVTSEKKLEMLIYEVIMGTSRHWPAVVVQGLEYSKCFSCFPRCNVVDDCSNVDG